MKTNSSSLFFTTEGSPNWRGWVLNLALVLFVIGMVGVNFHFHDDSHSPNEPDHCLFCHAKKSTSHGGPVSVVQLDFYYFELDQPLFQPTSILPSSIIYLPDPRGPPAISLQII